MAHPHNEHREHHVQERRVAHITNGYAAGGRVGEDQKLLESPDRLLVRNVSELKPPPPKPQQKAHGGKVKHRADRPHRAHGGKVKGKGTNVNVIIAPQGGHMPPPGLGAPPPRPPMPVPGPAAGAPPMAGPGPMMPHASGGRAYASGGAVKPGPAWREGLRHGTPVQHTDGKKDGKDVGRKRVVTFMAGGRVEHPTKGGMAPKLPSGSGGGEARLVKEKRAARNYGKPGPTVHGGARG